MDKILVHDRVGVQGQAVPLDPESIVDIPECFFDDLDVLRDTVTELNNGRLELGRLMQVVNHLIHVCNTAEKNSADLKRKIILGLGLGEGNYAIDFDNKQVGRVLDTNNKSPKVV